MPDIAFQRAEINRQTMRFRHRLFQRIDLYRIAKLGASTMSLNILQLAQVDLFKGCTQQLSLALGIRRRQRLGPAAMLMRTAFNHGQDVVAVFLCQRKRLQDDHAHTLPSNITIGIAREGVATPIQAQHACMVRLGEALDVE